MAFNLRKFAERVIAQAVPGDNKTYATVARAQARQAPPARTPPPNEQRRPAPAVQQKGFSPLNNSVTRGISRGFDQVNMFDNNRTWVNPVPTANMSVGQQAKKLVVENVVKPIAKSANTMAGAGIQGVQGTADLANIGRESVFGTDKSYQRALNQATQRSNQNIPFSNSGGLMGAGTDFQNASELNDPKKLASTALMTGSNLSSVVAPSMSLKAGFVQGGKTQVTKLVAGNVVDNAVNSAASQYSQTGKVDPKMVALSGAVGVAVPVAGYAGGRVARGAVNQTGTAATKLVNKVVETPELSPQQLGQRNELVSQRSVAQLRKPDVVPMYDKQIDAIDATRRPRLRNPLKPLNEGGYAKIPGKGEADKVDGMQWYRGTDNLNKQRGDKFYSASKDVAGDYGTVGNVKPNELPKKPLTVTDKDELAQIIGYKGDPYVQPKGIAESAKFDTLAKSYAQANGYDSINYKSGSLGEPELHVFGKPTGNKAVRQTTSSESSVPELSASSPRNYDQGMKLQEQPTPKNQIETTSNLDSTSNLSSVNSTPSTRNVKLNTSRMNPDGGYDAMARLDKDTAETITTMSNKDVQQVAKGAGIDTKTHTDEQIRTKIAEQLNVRQDAVRYMNEAEVARKNGDVELTKELLAKAAEQGRVSRAQGTELAQQLQARRIIANQLDTPQQRIFKLMDNAGINPEAYVKRFAEVDFNNAKQVMDAYRDLVPPKASEWLDTVRYNSMLSSPLTQMVNIFGNAQNVALVAPVEKTLRGSLDALGGVFGKERRYASGEGLAYAGGSITNLKNATINFRDALKGTGKYANPDFEEYSIPLATKGVSGGVYKTLSFPMRVLDGMDKFFRTLASGGEDAALNLRQKKGIAIGGNKQALLEQEAAYRVFQQDLHTPGQGTALDAMDSFASLVMSGRNSKNPIVSTISKFTVPFVKTINNINKQGMIEYSPVGFVNLKGNSDKVTAITRATMGSAVFGMSAMLIGANRMTWAEPRNAEDRARFRSEGKQPYSVKIGDKWFGFSKLTPSIAFPMAMSAALDDALKSKKLDQSNVDAILEAVSKYGNFMSDQSYAKSVGDLLGAIGGDKEAVASTVSNNIQQVVPFRAFTGWVARMTDDVERKVDVTQSYFDQQVQSLMQQYPGLRQKTTTRDYRGAPIPANNPIFNGFSPVKVTTDRGVNPIDQAIDEGEKLAGDGSTFDKAQNIKFNKYVAPKIDKAQKDLMKSQEYQSLDAVGKRKALEKIKTQFNHAYKRDFASKNKIGQFADDFKGKAEAPNKNDIAILQGKYNPTDATKSTSTTKTTLNEKDYYKVKDAEYKDYQRKYDEDKKAGKISELQDIDRRKKLTKLQIGAKYDKEARDLWGKSKATVFQYISSQPADKANSLTQQLTAYDQELYQAGVAKYATFKNGIAPKGRGGGKRSGGKRVGRSGGKRKGGGRKGGGRAKGTTKNGEEKAKLKDYKLASLVSARSNQDRKLRQIVKSAEMSNRSKGSAKGDKVATRKYTPKKGTIKRGNSVA